MAYFLMENEREFHHSEDQNLDYTDERGENESLYCCNLLLVSFYVHVNFITLSHLSERNSRGYISHLCLTAGMHLNIHHRTLKCIPGKWLHFKRSSHYHQSKDCLDVEHCTLSFYTYKFDFGSKFNA